MALWGNLFTPQSARMRCQSSAVSLSAKNPAAAAPVSSDKHEYLDKLSAGHNHIQRPNCVPKTGKATFLGVPAGAYYVFGTTHNNHLALSWDVRVDLRSGGNSLTLDQKNAGTLQ